MFNSEIIIVKDELKCYSNTSMRYDGVTGHYEFYDMHHHASTVEHLVSKVIGKCIEQSNTLKRNVVTHHTISIPSLKITVHIKSIYVSNHSIDDCICNSRFISLPIVLLNCGNSKPNMHITIRGNLKYRDANNIFERFWKFLFKPI